MREQQERKSTNTKTPADWKRTEETMEGATLSSPSLNLAYLKAAFMAMEPADCFLKLARECGGGLLTEEVQSFVYENCIRDAMAKCFGLEFAYVKNILKRVILSAESSHEAVYEGLYEQIAEYMSSIKDHVPSKIRVLKHISFFFENEDNQHSKNFSVPLQCSLNMLDGDTGCVIWQSSLFLAEFILSYPKIFCNKKCFEVGSGVGLLGIVLVKVKASEVILSDGDLSSIANLKQNLQLNQMSPETAFTQKTQRNFTSIKCKHLPWETATENDLNGCQPEIILGADVIYNPSCVPHLVRLLSLLFTRTKRCIDANEYQCNEAHKRSSLSSNTGDGSPTAYIATVIRNVETYNCFLRAVREAQLAIVDITETEKPMKLLPYMLSYDRPSVRLYRLSCSVH